MIAGTPITVELILEKLAAGESVEQILEAHPRLTREDVHAAVAFEQNQQRTEIRLLPPFSRYLSWTSLISITQAFAK